MCTAWKALEEKVDGLLMPPPKLSIEPRLIFAYSIPCSLHVYAWLKRGCCNFRLLVSEIAFGD